jgi:hypothetical protein
MIAQSPAELWENVTPHVRRVARRVWRRQVATPCGDNEETFVRNAIGRIFEAMTIPVRATSRVQYAAGNTIATQSPRRAGT